MFEASNFNMLLLALIQKIGAEFSSVWFYYQLGIIAVLGLASHQAGTFLAARVRIGERTMGWPAGLRLIMRNLTGNIGVAIFIVALLIVRLVMVEITWPSRSYLIGIALNLASVWILIRVIASTVRNNAVTRVVAIAAWLAVALHLLGLLEPLLKILDSVSFAAGQLRISPLMIMKAGILFGALLWVGKMIGNFVELRTTRMADLTPSAQVLINKILRLVTFALAILIAMSAVGIDLSALAFFSGAIGLGLGFGLQKIVGNFISGIILLADKSIKPGDIITVGDSFGKVSVMNTRFLSLASPDGREFLIPNEDLITQKVTNWTYSNRHTGLNTTFGVSYDCDPEQVQQLAIETAMTLPRVLKSQPPVCQLTEFGDSALIFALYFWIEDPEEGIGNVRSEVMFALWNAFKRAGISFPFPVRDLRLRVEGNGLQTSLATTLSVPSHADKPSGA